MPRWKSNKTRKAVSKRFKITATGKVLCYGAGRRHLLRGKSSKRMHGIGKEKQIGPTDAHRIKMNLPFGT